MKRKKRSKKNMYNMTRDLMNATPNMVLGISVAGMIPKLVP